MSLSVIPITMKAYVTATAVSGDNTLYQLVFYKNTDEEEVIDGVVAVYTAEDLQIPALSTQRYYGIYFNPIIEGDNLIFKAAYGGYVYTAVVADDDTDILSGNEPMLFSNDEVEERLLPEATAEDVGKVPTVQEDGSYALETPEEGVQELDDLTDVVISEPTDGQILKYNAEAQKRENETPDSGYDEKAHTINITNFNPADLGSSIISFNAPKFMSKGRYIDKVNITKYNRETADETCSPIKGYYSETYGTIIIPANTVITFNDTINVANFPSYTVVNFAAKCSDISVIVNIRFDGYSNQPADHMSYTGGGIGYTYTAYKTDGTWENASRKTITLRSNQTVSTDFAIWLAQNSDYPGSEVNRIYENIFYYKETDKYYKITTNIGKVNDEWTASSTVALYTPILPTPTSSDAGKVLNVDNNGNYQLSKIYPDAPSADGTYALQVTVSSGNPTYSWVSTT